MSDKKNISEYLEEIKTAFKNGNYKIAENILSEAAKFLAHSSNLSECEIYLWEKFGEHLISTGEIEKLSASLLNLIKIHSWNSKVHSDMLFTLHHLPNIDQQKIFEEHIKWAQIHAPVDNSEIGHDNDVDPNRRLRIGYISPDFRTHPIAFFIAPVIFSHDRQKVEVYGYGNVAKPDATTESLKSLFDNYRNILGLDDRALVDLIREDRIDILIELAGHTNDNNLTVLAQKAAPIQVSYLGYPGTTGMTQIDYRMVDEVVNVNGSQKFYTEELIYLHSPFTCYNNTELPTSPLPAERNGYITFGSFQNNCKINRDVISVWAEILKIQKNSRLLLRFAKGNEPSVREFYYKQFESLSIPRQRVEIRGWLPYIEHLQQYEGVDIALDAFPFNGHATICDALWMGVPTISLASETFASRLGLCMLKSVGLDFFSAQTTKEYIAKAVSLAQNIPSLSKIRATMRQRMLASNLYNPKILVSAMEDAYRKMWHKWCSKQSGVSCQKDKISNPAAANIILQPKAKRGILYMIWGNNEKFESTLQKSIASAKQYHPELPIHIERLKEGGKINKTRICDITPFEETVFLDNDTVVMGRLDYGFEKAKQFGLACVINECPWARRYTDSRLNGDMVEYNSGVLFFTQKAKPVFKDWEKLFPTTNASIIHIVNGKKSLMPVADQGSFALAMEQTGFLPFVLPINWNYRAQFYRACYGPIKIWHSYYDIPENLHEWNKKQSADDAILQFLLLDMTKKALTV